MSVHDACSEEFEQSASLHHVDGGGDAEAVDDDGEGSTLGDGAGLDTRPLFTSGLHHECASKGCIEQIKIDYRFCYRCSTRRAWVAEEEERWRRFSDNFTNDPFGDDK